MEFSEILELIDFDSFEQEIEEDASCDLTRESLDAVKNGDLIKLANIALIYAKGGEVVMKDGDKAFKLCNYAVENGCLDGYLLLSEFYEFGIGVERDMAKSLEILQSGADKGSASAMLGLAMLNRRQRTSPPFHSRYSSEEEVKLLEKAAELDCEEAKFLVGLDFLRGDKCERDYHKAVKFLRMAYDNDNERSVIRSEVKRELEQFVRRAEPTEKEMEGFGELSEFNRFLRQEKETYKCVSRATGESYTMKDFIDALSSGELVPENPVVLWFDSIDIQNDERRKLERIDGCAKFDGDVYSMPAYAVKDDKIVEVAKLNGLKPDFLLPYNYKPGKTKFFIYHRYVEQLETQYMSYCKSVFAVTGIPVICLVNNYSMARNYHEEEFDNYDYKLSR